MRPRKILRGLKDGLMEDERYAVADHVVSQLKQRGLARKGRRIFAKMVRGRWARR